MNLTLRIQADIPLMFSIEAGWVSRRYGHKLPANILHVSGTFHSTCCVTSMIQVESGIHTHGMRARAEAMA
jgi:hypothetical protein